MFSYAQNKPLKVVPFFIDSRIVSQFMDSLQKKGSSCFFVFITKEDVNSFTYLIWKEKKNYKIIRIGDTIISKPRFIQLSFIKTNFKKLAILESEDKLQLVPPLESNNYCNYFIYITSKSKLLIEGGSNCTNFITDKNKNSLRCNFIDTVKKDISSLDKSWDILIKHDRYSDY